LVCDICGGEVRPGAVFCTQCGTRRDASARDQASPVLPARSSPSTGSHGKRRWRRATLTFSLPIVALFLATTVAVMPIFGRSLSSAATHATATALSTKANRARQATFRAEALQTQVVQLRVRATTEAVMARKRALKKTLRSRSIKRAARASAKAARKQGGKLALKGASLRRK
jgi:uncharacterized iron-regulated membrane protein